MNDIGLKQLLASCPKEKLFFFINGIPENKGAWLLQQSAAANEMTVVFIATEALRNNSYSLLKSFLLEIKINEAEQEALRLALISTLERQELELIINKPCSSSTAAEKKAAIETAREIFSMIPERLILPFFKELEAEMPELCSQIRDYLFFFEDIVLLDNISIQRLLRQVDTDDLITALVGAEDRVKEAFTRNMSKRAVEYLEEDLLSCSDADEERIDESRGNIINLLRRMEESGEIVISAENNDIEQTDKKQIVKNSNSNRGKGEELAMEESNLFGYIDLIMDLDNKARRNGLLALEDEIANLESSFMKLGVQLVVDGSDPEIVRKILENIIETGDFSKTEKIKREIIKEGVCGIQEGFPGRILRSLLCSYIGEEEAFSAYVE